MKKIITTVTTVLTIFALYAQTAPPNAFNYSGVARNPNNTPMANQNIGVQFSVLKSNPTTGIVVYSKIILRQPMLLACLTYLLEQWWFNQEILPTLIGVTTTTF